MPPEYRTVYEEPEFEAARIRIQPDCKGMDLALKGIIITICEFPDIGHPTDVEGVLFITTHYVYPPLGVWYTYDENAVYLRRLRTLLM